MVPKASLGSGNSSGVHNHLPHVGLAGGGHRLLAHGGAIHLHAAPACCAGAKDAGAVHEGSQRQVPGSPLGAALDRRGFRRDAAAQRAGAQNAVVGPHVGEVDLDAGDAGLGHGGDLAHILRRAEVPVDRGSQGCLLEALARDRGLLHHRRRGRGVGGACRADGGVAARSLALHRGAASQARRQVAVVQRIELLGARGLTGIAGESLQLALRHTWLELHGEDLLVLGEVLLHANAELGLLVGAKGVHVAKHPLQGAHLSHACLALSDLLCLGRLPLRNRRVVTLVIGLPSLALAGQLFALGVLSLSAWSTASWNVRLGLRDNLLHMAIAVLEAPLRGAHDVVAAVGLVVPGQIQNAHLRLKLSDHAIQEGLVALTAHWGAIQRATLLTQRGAVLAHHLHLGCAVVVAGRQVSSNHTFPGLALGVGLEVLLIPRCGVGLEQGRRGKSDMIGSLIGQAAAGHLLLGCLDGCQTLLVCLVQRAFHCLVEHLPDLGDNVRGVRSLRHAACVGVQQVSQGASHRVQVHVRRCGHSRNAGRSIGGDEEGNGQGGEHSQGNLHCG
mmetsp:Transcript_93943/g.223540  ORF Transcript_93943/g.223540 Transcript_93943/m.223540 type:complete len:558 (-) Transcript_93943:44-1717(-)